MRSIWGGNSLEVQWLGLDTWTSIPGQRTEILQATRCSQKNKKLGGKKHQKVQKAKLEFALHQPLFTYHLHRIHSYLHSIYIVYCIVASLVAQSVKNLPAVQETWIRSLGWEEPLEKEMATHSSILAWKISWTEGPGGLQSVGSQRLGHD